jgi:hypothetical protein
MRVQLGAFGESCHAMHPAVGSQVEHDQLAGLTVQKHIQSGGRKVRANGAHDSVAVLVVSRAQPPDVLLREGKVGEDLLGGDAEKKPALLHVFPGHAPAVLARVPALLPQHVRVRGLRVGHFSSVR